MSHLREIFNYREMVYELARRELRGRYQRSVFGMLWNFLNPLFQILIYTILFTYIYPSTIPYFYLYLTVGIVPWTFFSESLSMGTSSIVVGGNMVTKIYFPREVLVIASVSAKFVNLIMSLMIVFVFIIFSGHGLNLILLLYLPFIMLAEYFMTLGFTLILSAMDVYLRDIEYIITVVMMAWIWATPIMYDLEAMSPTIQKIIRLNPMTHIIEAYHNILYDLTAPSIGSIVYIWGLGILLMIIGEIVFRRLEKNFAEEL